MSAYQEMSDEQVALLASSGDKLAEEALLDKYKDFVKYRSRSYFLIGADREDIVQEGMIGLFKAIRDYKPDRQSSFRTFAELCITRQIITAVKTATRRKHAPLNTYISLSKPAYDDDSDRILLEVITAAKDSDPEELVIKREEYDDIAGKLQELLSPFERQVLTYYLDGKSYQEMAEGLDRHTKSIDNALQRVKRKLEQYLGSRELS